MARPNATPGTAAPRGQMMSRPAHGDLFHNGWRRSGRGPFIQRGVLETDGKCLDRLRAFCAIAATTAEESMPPDRKAPIGRSLTIRILVASSSNSRSRSAACGTELTCSSSVQASSQYLRFRSFRPAR